jgi:general nucleoside transport system permease protein
MSASMSEAKSAATGALVSPSLAARLDGLRRWAIAILGPLVLFGALAAAKGASPIQAYRDIIDSLLRASSVSQVLVKATPILLAGLAVAVPARAGLVNVGGEGQLVIGAVAGFGTSIMLGDNLPGWFVIAAMVVAAGVSGALWSSVAAILKTAVGINEAVTTLLMNYIAIDVMAYLVYDRWKDRKGSGQPVSKALPLDERLPSIGFERVHFGLIIALVALVIVILTFKFTTFGFQLRVVGGNQEAARRAGFRVTGLMLSAMCIGGALAGIGGFAQLAGVEFKLRQGLVTQYGYIAYLASWLATHKPSRLVVSTLILSALAIGGDSLQIDSQLPASSINVLMALILLGTLGWKKGKTA